MINWLVLDVQSLLQLRVTCRVMRDLASRDEAGWIDACRRFCGRPRPTSAKKLWICLNPKPYGKWERRNAEGSTSPQSDLTHRV